jgi:anthranilate synthase/aminodeoxychorismate synthase-like glutamine amidotransferase
MKPSVLLVDNYDSFVHNLARYLRELGAETTVHRNDSLAAHEIEELRPSHIVVSPGPCTPRQAGISNEVIRSLGPRIPILGVCLGHQCLADALGGRVVQAPRPRHGKTSPILHSAEGLFAGLPSPFQATRYHSLIVSEDGLPESLEVVARTPDGEVMALRHRDWPSWGVQFHPESVLTEHGHDLLRNFLALRAEAA